jgi:hypothetical protein
MLLLLALRPNDRATDQLADANAEALKPISTVELHALACRLRKLVSGTPIDAEEAAMHDATRSTTIAMRSVLGERGRGQGLLQIDRVCR